MTTATPISSPAVAIRRDVPAATPTIGEALLWGLFAGTIFFRGDFAHIRIGPAYVTDVTLFALFGLAALFYPQRLFALGRSEKIFVAYTVLCGLHAIGGLEHGMWTLKDATLGGYALFALVVPAFVSSRVGLERFGIVAIASVVGLSIYAPFLPDIGGNASFYLGAGALGLLTVLSVKMRFMAAGAFCVFLLEMVLSGRRASALAVVVGAAVLFVAVPSAARRRLVRTAAVLMGCGVVTGLAAMSIPAISERATWGAERYLSGTVGYQTDGTAQWRLGAWRNALALIGEHPVLGVGFGIPVNVYPVDEPPEKMASPYNYGLPHNTYLTVALKTGIPGLVLLVGGLIAWFRSMWRLRHVSRWACGFLGLASYAAFYGYFALFFERPFMAMPFWILIGLGLALARMTAAEQEHPDIA